jgi:hypothetical protein
VWKCGATWRWVGTYDTAAKLDSGGKLLEMTLRRLDTQQGYVNGGHAELYPLAEALILGKDGKTNEVRA